MSQCHSKLLETCQLTGDNAESTMIQMQDMNDFQLNRCQSTLHQRLQTTHHTVLCLYNTLQSSRHRLNSTGFFATEKPSKHSYKPKQQTRTELKSLVTSNESTKQQKIGNKLNRNTSSVALLTAPTAQNKQTKLSSGVVTSIQLHCVDCIKQTN